ncbi:MAG TPA: carboxypeptidase regulatory-like domain-containing protein, partial [Longimicrobiales bacterium]|nr:carboxypeptidase regulatory-like domain-containing protein [Longimicrobiales bacterium]
MRRQTPIPLVIVAVALLPTLALDGSASAQQATIRGVVQERTDGSPIAEASVRLGDGLRAVTGADGGFVLERVDPGPYTIQIDALGYVSRRVDVVIRGDTTLVIRLEVDPIRIDQIEARLVTIRGTLHDATTGERLQSGQVRIEPGGETASASYRGFRIQGVPSGPVRVVVRALEYLPAVFEFDAERDTTLRVDMRVDSVGIKLLLQQVDRLAQRAEAEPYSVRELDRDDISHSGAPTIGDFITRQLPSWRGRPPMVLSRQRRAQAGRSPLQRRASSGPACVTYDDVPVELDVLEGIPSDLVERVEIFGYGGRMVRVYSKRYVASLMGQEKLPRIIF